MWYKIIVLFIIAKVSTAGEFFKIAPAKRLTGKGEVIPLHVERIRVQKSWGNPVIQKWGTGLGAAAVLGPADTPLIDWWTELGWTGDIIFGIWNIYDPSEFAYVLGGIDPGDTFVSYFQPPVACTIVAFGIYYFNDEADPSANLTYFASWTREGVAPESLWSYGRGTYPDTEASGLGRYIDYHYGYDYPGPVPFDKNNWITAPTTISVPYDTLNIQYTVFYPDTVIDDSLADEFWVGWVPLTAGASNAMPWVIITSNYGTGNWKCWIYQQDLSGFGISPGWYNQWHGYWMDAFVWVYEDPPPSIIWVEELPWTFSTGPFKIKMYAKDILGIPSANQSIKACTLEVYAIPSSPTPQYIEGVPLSGDSTATAGLWEFTFGNFAPGDTVYYRIYSVYDYSGGVTSEDSYHKFVILEYNPDVQFLFVDEDQDAWAQYAYDIFNELVDYTDTVADGTPSAFFWDTKTMGYLDSSVLDVNKFKAVFWTALEGDTFAFDTVNIKNYLNSGGNLFVSSQDFVCGGFGIGDYTTETSIKTDFPGHFLHTYMKMDRVLDDAGGFPPGAGVWIYGFPGDPISDPLPTYWMRMDSFFYSGYSGYVFPDDLGNAVYDTVFPCWFYGKVTERESGTPAGYWYDGTNYGEAYKLVFFYFNYQYLDSLQVKELTKRILDFFGYEVVSVSETPKIKPSKMKLSLKAPSIAGLGNIFIYYTIPEPGNVKISLFDASGRLIKNLFKGRKKEGAYTISFGSKGLKSGTYFIKIECKGKSESQKLILIR